MKKFSFFINICFCASYFSLPSLAIKNTSTPKEEAIIYVVDTSKRDQTTVIGDHCKSPSYNKLGPCTPVRKVRILTPALVFPY